MNKGFVWYFRQAFKVSAQTIWKNKNVIKSMLYFFMSLVARLTIILGGMVSLADVRQAKIAKNERTVDVPQSLTKASQKPLWTHVVATIIEALMYLGGFLLVSVVCGAIFAVGLVIAQFVAAKYIWLIYTIFAVPCLLVYLIYTIIVVAVFSPTAYVIDSNPELSAGEVVSVCVNSMKSRGKMTVILSVFVPLLIMLLIAGVCAAGFVLIFVYLAGHKYTLLLTVCWAIASALILGLTIPVFNMTQNLSLVLLFEDIALDPVNARKRTAGINIKKISGARLDREEIADNLDALFDPALSEKTPEGEQLIHKHKPKKRAPAPVQTPKPVQSPAPAPQSESVDDGLDEEDDYADELPAEEPAATDAANTENTQENADD